MQAAARILWRQGEQGLRPLLERSSRSSQLHPLRLFCSNVTEGDAGAKKKRYPKRINRKKVYGTYDDAFEDSIEHLPEDETPGPLYNARGMLEEQMGPPTIWDKILEDVVEPGIDPPGEGPILRWETRVVLGPGGDAWHPANRKVKVSLYVKELGLSPKANERLLALVGKRYNPSIDELTIVSERYAAREENRKDVYRIILELIEEARKADKVISSEVAEELETSSV